MKRLLFSADGSSGDLLPIILMAREFKSAGYEVCVCGSAELTQMAVDFEVPFEPYPHSYSKLYLDHQKPGYLHNIRETIRHRELLFQGEYDLLSKIAPAYDVLFNFLGDLFVPSFAEAFGLTNIKLFTFPVMRCDRYGPPMGLPYTTENKWINQGLWLSAVLGSKYLFSYNATVNRLRGQMGLAPIDDLLGNNARCDHMMMGVYEELIPRCETWNFDYSYIGPCIPSNEVPLSDALEEFLAAGSKPIYIGFGSMRHANSEELTRNLLAAVEATGVRAILAQNNSEIGGDLAGSENVHLLRDYPIPHHVLFPRLKAAVHHGSWITTHMAARAGIPQLILPQVSDQYLWADVVARKGLGPDWVDMNRMNPRKLVRAIDRLVQSREYEDNARDLGDRVRGINGVKNAVQVAEQLFARGASS